jgi:predicted nucleic acid-binding protein
MGVADTNVIIAGIRGNEIAKSILRKHAKKGIFISVITEMELHVGATNAAKKTIVRQVMASHEVLQLNKAIGELALQLIIEHNNNRRVLYMGDALVAATCLYYNCRLITFNTKDFSGIKGLQLAK